MFQAFYDTGKGIHGADDSIELKDIKSEGYINDDKEKAILDLSFAAGKTPNQSAQRHFDNLHKHFSKKEITDIVSVIALFGFLNRWNDTMGTVLEDVPENFVENQLKPLGWS